MWFTRVLGLGVVFGLVLTLAASSNLTGQEKKPEDEIKCRIIYVPTPQIVVEKMLDMAKVNREMMEVTAAINKLIHVSNAVRTEKEPNVTVHDVLAGKGKFASVDVTKLMKELAKNTDVVYDLGCGDGRIVCTAAKKYGAKGVGVDIDPDRIKDCMETMKKFGVTKEQVDIRRGDALKVKDLDNCTVIMLYMLPEFMEKLEDQALKLKPGTRIVAHDYAFPNWKADVVVEYTGEKDNKTDRTHTLYMWTVKEKK